MVLRAHTTEGKAGSIGPSWPPALTNSHRLRGIHPAILATPSQSARFIDEIHAAQRANPEFSRISIRTFVERSERKRLGARWNGVKVEGIIPADHVFGAPVDFVYLGYNDRSRIPRPDVFKRMLRANFAQTTVPRADHEAMVRRISTENYVIKRLTTSRVTDEDINALIRLYKEALPVYMIEITPATMHELLSNHGNIFLVARQNGRIAAALIAEHSSIMVDGREIHLYELSDFATFREHQGRGLMTALQMTAIKTIRRIYGDSAIIYAEDRAPWPAVVRSSVQAGLTLVGVLPLHVNIGGINEFDEGVPGMETLLPVALVPESIPAPSVREIAALHDVSI